ncbi:MAG TPA: hypothetical protein VF434_13490, partial [Promineifilum sp.]
DDWTLFAAAAAPNDGRNFSNPGGSGVFETVFANAGYDLSESAEPGYEAGPWNCDGGTLVGSTITLDEGDEVICTITNDDIAPTLTIVKAVNGSDPPTWSFTGPAPFGMFTLPAGGGSKGPEDVMAGEDITVAEDDVTNPDSSTAWVLTSIECTDGTSGNLATRDVTVNLDLDENVTCTFTNDKIAISIVKTTADDFSNEGDGIGILPGENVTWNYLVTNTGVAQLDNIVVTDDQGVTVTCPQTSLAPGESMTCTASGIAAAGSYHNIGTVTGENSGTEITDSDPSSYFGLTPGVVTNSSLCDFGEQFRLIFTPDIKNYTASNPAYKLSDSNPGQFFYNVFYVNDSDPLAQTITMEIPYPFVTQGANPVHVYGGVFVNPENEMNCFEPANELASYGEIITLASYTDTNGDGMVGFGDVVLVDVPAEEGFQYVNIHLDYGLEKSNGWIKKGANAVNDPLINPNFTGISIIDNTAHTFKAYVDGVLLAGSTDTIYNLNEFKQIRGFGGTVQYWNGVSFEPLAGAQVQLIGPGGNVIETMTTDGDGWYLSNYQHKGKAATYTLRLLAGVAPSGPYGQQQVTGILVGGSVKFGEGNFLIP